MADSPTRARVSLRFLCSTMSASPSDHFTSYGTIKPPSLRSRSLQDDNQDLADVLPTTSADTPQSTLHRGLSSRQVQMIAIAGTIGTGLFLGTGRSLAQGGPATMLICYSVVGFIVYITLLLLGEMATQYPVAGESLNTQSRLERCLVPNIWAKLSFFAKSSYLYERRVICLPKVAFGNMGEHPLAPCPAVLPFASAF